MAMVSTEGWPDAANCRSTRFARGAHTRKLVVPPPSQVAPSGCSILSFIRGDLSMDPVGRLLSARLVLRNLLPRSCAQQFGDSLKRNTHPGGAVIELVTQFVDRLLQQMHAQQIEGVRTLF